MSLHSTEPMFMKLPTILLFYTRLSQRKQDNSYAFKLAICLGFIMTFMRNPDLNLGHIPHPPGCGSNPTGAITLHCCFFKALRDNYLIA